MENLDASCRSKNREPWISFLFHDLYFSQQQLAFSTITVCQPSSLIPCWESECFSWIFSKTPQLLSHKRIRSRSGVVQIVEPILRRRFLNDQKEWNPKGANWVEHRPSNAVGSNQLSRTGSVSRSPHGLRHCSDYQSLPSSVVLYRRLEYSSLTWPRLSLAQHLLKRILSEFIISRRCSHWTDLLPNVYSLILSARSREVAVLQSLWRAHFSYHQFLTNTFWDR